MSHLIKGILTSSLGEPYTYTPITIIPTRNGSKLLGAEAVYTTTSLGEYEFTLTEGHYNVLIQYSDTKELTGSIVVDEGLPDESSLEFILDYTGTVKPDTFTSTSVTWEDLFNDLESSTFTSTRLIPNTTQDDEGNVFHYNVKGALFNDVIPSKKSVELTQVKADEVENVHEVYSYSDTGINEITNTRNMSATSELFFESNTTLEHSRDNDPRLTNKAEFTNGRVSGKYEYSLPDNSSHLIKTEVISPEVYELEERTSSITSLTENSLKTHTTGSKSTNVDKVTTLDYVDDSYTLTELREYKVSVGNVGYITEQKTVVEDSYGDVSTQSSVTHKVGGIEYSSITSNDGSSTRKEILVDHLVIGNKSNDLIHVDSYNNQVNINGRLNITFANIPDLEHGRTIYDEYRYYPNNTELNYDLWHTVFITGDKYRIQRLVTDYGDGNITYSQWSTPAFLAGEDGLEGDSLYFEYRYTDSTEDGSPNESNWHNPPMLDGDQWRIEREVVKGVAGDWSEAARIVGADGGDGRGSRLEVEYAADSLGGQFGWHTNYSEGDHWRRERLVTILFDGSEVAEPWQISKLVPEVGIDYGYQNANIFIYQRGATKPAEPIGIATYNFITGELAGLNNGWSSSIPEGIEPIWIGAATVWSLSTTDTIAANEWVFEQLSVQGEDGESAVYTSYVYINATTPPTSSPTGGTFDGDRETFPSGSLGTYSDNPETPLPNEATYVSTAKYTYSKHAEAWSHTGWSLPARFSGFVGDTIYYEYQYSADGTSGWHDDFIQGTDLYQRERLVTVATEGTSYGEWTSGSEVKKLVPELGVDYVNGIDGSFVSYIYKLSDTSLTPSGGSFNGTTEVIPSGWSDNPMYSDSVKTQVSTCRYQKSGDSWIRSPEWSSSVQYLGEDGDEGIDGTYSSFVFRKGLTTPTDIDTDGSVTNKGSYDGTTEVTPTNWYDDPPTPLLIDGVKESIYMSKAVYFTEDNINWSRREVSTGNTWSTPVKWTGDNAFNVATVMLYKLGETQPSVPNNTLTYTFGTAALSGSLDGWSTEVPDNSTEGGKVWVTFNTALSQGDTDVLDVDDWSNPEVMSKNGLDGVAGEQGQHGSGSYVYYTSASASYIRGQSNSQHDDNFYFVARRYPKNRDIIGYQNNVYESDESKWFRIDYIYMDGVWEEFTNVVNGNMIIHGTVASHHIVAATFTGDEFNAAFSIVAGSGNNVAGMNGNDSSGSAYENYRFWAGNANPAIAPFRVTYNGSVTMTNADVTGKITATSGSFTGAITAGAGSSIDAAYIQDLVVDTLQIKDQAVTQPISVEFSNRSTSGNTSTTLGSISLGVYSSGGVAFSFAIKAERINDSGSNDEVASVTVSMYAGGSFVKSYSFSSSLFHDNAEFTIPATGMFTDAQLSSYRGSSLSITVSVGMSGYPSGTAYWSGSGFTMYAKK